MSKNVVEPEGPQMTSQYGAYALDAGLASLHTRTRMPPPGHARPRTPTDRPISNTYCFSTAIMIRVRLSVLRCTYSSCVLRVNIYSNITGQLNAVSV